MTNEQKKRAEHKTVTLGYCTYTGPLMAKLHKASIRKGYHNDYAGFLKKLLALADAQDLVRHVKRK